MGWFGLGGLVIAAILMPTYRETLLSIVVLWVIACWAYIMASRSALPFRQLLKNALIVCLFAGVWTFVMHGEPDYDDDGQVVEEGFDATTAQRTVAGARTFGRLAVATLAGVTLAVVVRRRDGLSPEPQRSANSPFDHTYDHGESGL